VHRGKRKGKKKNSRNGTRAYARPFLKRRAHLHAGSWLTADKVLFLWAYWKTKDSQEEKEKKAEGEKKKRP